MNVNHLHTARRFHLLGRIIAVLELGAQAHGEIRWLHLYYAKGLTPNAGLRDPLQKHSQSVLPRLQRQDRAQVYKATLDSLARDLQEASGLEQPTSSFDSWAIQVLKDRKYRETDTLPSSCNPGDAVDYAQGYLEQRKALQPNRPELPPAAETAKSIAGNTTWAASCPGTAPATIRTCTKPSSWG